MRIPTEQELFDNAALGIISQNYQAAVIHYTDNNGNSIILGCRVLTEEGLRCAIGHSVTDATPDAPSTPQWLEVCERSSIASDLQLAHDEDLAFGDREKWMESMARIALNYYLDDSILYFTPAD